MIIIISTVHIYNYIIITIKLIYIIVIHIRILIRKVTGPFSNVLGFEFTLMVVGESGLGKAKIYTYIISIIENYIENLREHGGKENILILDIKISIYIQAKYVNIKKNQKNCRC